MAKPAGKSPSALRTARILKVLSGRTNRQVKLLMPLASR